jgi:mannose-1-phosphate guanylyltransferase/phosphomannomutase
MKAVIMAGGEGVRLRPLTLNRAKPMVPVANRPLLEHLISHLRSFGITEIILSLYSLPEGIISYFGDGSRFGVSISYSIEESPLGTAGGVKLAAEDIYETFIVLSGDTVTDIPLDTLVEFHRANRSCFTVALTGSENTEDYGVASLSKNGRLLSFIEKPGSGVSIPGLVNTGIYVVEPGLLRTMVPEGRRFDFSLNLIPLLLESGKPVYGRGFDSYWRDAGSIEAYLNINGDMARNFIQEMPRSVTGGAFTGVMADSSSFVAESARFAGYPVIGRECSIEESAFVCGSVILDGCRVCEGAVINRAVIGNGCLIGRGAVINEGAVIGDNSVVAAGCSVPSGMKLAPGTRYHAGLHRADSRLRIGRGGVRYDINVMIEEFISKIKRYSAV